jgi:hypothetical protein
MQESADNIEAGDKQLAGRSKAESDRVLGIIEAITRSLEAEQ